MSYCLNPACPQPQTIAVDRCATCGAALRLRGRYRALKLIGQGGFGRTFLAIDEAAPQSARCVIKQLLAPVAADRVRAEAQQLAGLGQHPQIPTLLAAGRQGGQHYVIQEFIDGPNLAEELAESGPFSEAQIREVLVRLLPVLQFLHDRQVIHRDIKPANLIRRRSDGQLVLVDLGAAKTATAALQTGTIIGSAEYVAPEQARGKAVLASDLYSLGVTCVVLLTGLSPFDLFDSVQDRWIWREVLPAPIRPSLARILDRLLERATSRRYPSAAAVQADLDREGFPLPEPLRAIAELARWVTPPPAATEPIWAEEGEPEPLWEPEPPPAADAVWSPDRDAGWAEEPDTPQRTPLWFKIALGVLLSSPFWAGLLSRSRP